MRRLLRIFALIVLPVVLAGAMVFSAEAATAKSYVATNDDNPSGNTTTVYVWNGKKLTQIKGSPFSTGGYGLGGGYFSIPREAISVGSNGKCLFVGDPYNSSFGASDIAAFQETGPPPVLTLVGNYTSASGYSGAEDGVGLVTSGNTLIANYTLSGVQEEWTIGSGCKLTETGKTITAYGGNEGVADGEWATSKCYFFAAADGTVTSATLSPFAVVGNYIAGGYDSYGAVPASVAATGGILYADDLGGNPALFDAWNIGSGCALSGDTTSGPLNGSIYGSHTFNISPDGTCSFVIGTYSGTIQTDAISGKSVSNTSCSDVDMPGYESTWSYPGQGGVALNSGGTAEIFIAEGSFGLSGNSFVGEFSISKSGCMMAASQVDDATMYLLSLATYTASPTQDSNANPPVVGPHCTH
jgi:hypothetical protein